MVPMSNTMLMKSEVMSAMHGELKDEDQEMLVRQVVGAFNGYPVFGEKIVQYAESRDWIELDGALGTYIDVESKPSHHTSVSAQSYSNATASVNIDMTVMIDMQSAIYESDEIDGDQKSELIKLMREAVDAAQRKELKKVGEILREWLGVTADIATVAQTMGPLLLLLGTLLRG